MLESDRGALLTELNKGRDALHDALAGVDEELAARKPDPAKWSILNCVEHLCAAEKVLFSRVKGASQSDGSHENREREAKILERGPVRSRPVEAPGASQPSGRFNSLQEALSAFDATRAETVRYVDGFGDDLRCWLTEHPVIPGPMNCYEMLLMIAIHPVRHANQIREIRAALEKQ